MAVAPQILDPAHLCEAELLSNALVQVARRTTSNPGVAVLAFAKALGCLTAQAEVEDKEKLLAAALGVAERALQTAQMDARLREAGILAVLEGGRA